MGFIGHGISVYDELSALENLALFGRLYSLADPQNVPPWNGWNAPVWSASATAWCASFRAACGSAWRWPAPSSTTLVLLLDEPFTALDDRAIAVLQRLLREALAAGKTIVMSTHQLREALELASHVALLVRGQVAFQGQCTPEMVDDPGYVYARYGEACSPL